MNPEILQAKINESKLSKSRYRNTVIQKCIHVMSPWIVELEDYDKHSLFTFSKVVMDTIAEILPRGFRVKTKFEYNPKKVEVCSDFGERVLRVLEYIYGKEILVGSDEHVKFVFKMHNVFDSPDIDWLVEANCMNSELTFG